MLPGSKVGPYEIIEPIGRGGMGEVYRAHDARLRRNVAIKTVASGALGDPAMRERFAREARAVAALSHPNILAIYDVGECDGIPYVAVELLEGDTLRPHLGTSPLPLSTALDYAVQIGRGLAAAHDRGIVHRDLKPENIFVTRDGQVKLLDFGLATEPAGETGDEATRAARTEAGLVLGTAGYMSPEQARGEHTDTHSDIFSFGCVLYEMLAGRRAFAGDQPDRHAPRRAQGASAGSHQPAQRRAAAAQPRGPALPGEGAGEPIPDGPRSRVRAREPGSRIGADAGSLAGGPGAPRERNGGGDRCCCRASGGRSGLVVDRAARTSASGGRLASPCGRGRPGCWPCCRSRTSRVAARDILHKA